MLHPDIIIAASLIFFQLPMSSRPNSPPFGSSSLQDNLFERYQKIWDRLTEAERNFFKATPVTGIGDIHMQIEKFQDKDRRLRSLRRIQPYVEGLDRYHTVISVFVQRKPEILSLIWVDFRKALLKE
jgi:hypothetical protein